MGFILGLEEANWLELIQQNYLPITTHNHALAPDLSATSFMGYRVAFCKLDKCCMPVYASAEHARIAAFHDATKPPYADETNQHHKP